MSAPSPAPDASSHPFVVAWQLRDPSVLARALAPDVTLWSPLLAEPFSGRDAVADLYGTLFEVFDDLQVTETVSAGETHVFVWQGGVGGRPVEGADLVRANAGGDISEIRVWMRPLATQGIVMAGVAAELGRRDGGLRGAAGCAMAGPTRVMFQAVQAVATRLGQRR